MEKLLREIKIRLDVVGGSPKDEILLSYISEVQEKVKSYCNRKNIPDGLFYTVASMAIELYKYRNSGIVLSETQGSRSLTYAGKNDIDSIVPGHSAELNRYRRIRAI